MNYHLITYENYKSYTQQIEIIEKLDQKYFPYPWKHKQWIEFCSHDDFVFSIAQHEEKLIGFCLFQENSLEMMSHLMKILVIPEFRKLGISKKIHAMCQNYLAQKGYEKLYLEVDTTNLAAKNLYSKLGYRPLVIKKKFYSSGADAYAMQKMIN